MLIAACVAAGQVGKELELQVLRPGSPSQLTLTVVALEAPSSRAGNPPD